MGRKRFVALEQIPDPGRSVLDVLIDAEIEPAETARGVEMKKQADAFRDQCRELTSEQQALCAAFLADAVPNRTWGRLTAAEIGKLFGRTATWVRVSKLIVRRRYPCGGGASSCGSDQPACAHARGRKILFRTVIKSFNRTAA
jgi:hypothetical protein